MNRTMEEKYISFASRISFFEFGAQNEYRPAMVDTVALSETIDELQLKNNWNIDDLSDYVTRLPASFELFENLFRLERFSNAQLIHFLFDTTKLNSNNMSTVYEYLILNLKFDNNFREVFLDFISGELGKQITYEGIVSDKERIPKELLVAYFKMVVNRYAIKADENTSYIENRIKVKQFNDLAIRLANYVINTLQLNQFLKAVRVRDYLEAKLIPVDTKAIHGNFLKSKVMNVLDRARIRNIDDELKKLKISRLPSDLGITIPDLRIGYCTEKYVENVNKPNNNKPKKFDLVIIVDGKPKHLFEANFYTTEGTKIGINEGEYVALNNSIAKIGKYSFHWITDGNYWLTKQGKERYLNLLERFSEIYNANMFEEKLDSFMR